MRLIALGLQLLASFLAWAFASVEVLTVGSLALAFPVAVWIGVAVGAKRLHDRDRSAWWLLLFYPVPVLSTSIGHVAGDAGFIPVAFKLTAFAIWIWGVVELGCLDGTVGPNTYGPAPLLPTA